MKSFHFTLARILTFKTQIFDREKELLLQIRRRKDELDLKIEQYKTAIRQLSKALLEKQRVGTTVTQLQYYNMQIDNARKCLVQLHQEQAAIEQELARQQNVVISASKEVTSLEKLRDKQLETFRYGEKRAREAELLEYVTGGLIRKSRKQVQADS